MEAVAEAGQHLEIAVLGGLGVTYGGAPVSFRLHKSAALLVYLVTEGRPVRRAVLSNLLWSELPESRGLANLRTVLHDLRRALPGCLVVERGVVVLQPSGSLAVDRRAFEAALPVPDHSVPVGSSEAADRAVTALGLYAGPFLEGFEVEGAPVFDDFVSFERQRLQRQAEALFELVAASNTARRGTRLAVRSVEPGAPLIGREVELAEVEALLADGARLVSVVGPGGVGKTRLAHEVVRRAGRAKRTPRGSGGEGSDREAAGWTAVVDLSGLREARDIPIAIAEELDLPLGGLRPPVDEVVVGLERVDGLLMLDNLEQLLPGAVDVLIALVKRCPSLRLIVTSRARLRVQAEQVVAVRPFPVPDPGSDADALRQSPAVRLFVAQAGAATDTGDLPSIARICAAVEALPLAIELVAARTRLLSPSEVLVNLKSVLDPVGQARDLPARQRTLRDSLSWSYQLLSEQGQAVLAAFGTFRGGAPLGALVAVADLGDDQGLAGALELVDAGLADRASSPAGTRLTIMESTQAFAVEVLVASEAADGYRRRHAQAFLDFARIGERAMRGPTQKEWMDRMGAELDNLRAALGYAVNGADAELALDLATCCVRFWYLRGHLPEGRDWLTRCLELADSAGQGPLTDNPADGPMAAHPDEQRDRRLSRLRGRVRLGLVLLAILQERADHLEPLVDQADRDFARAGDDQGRALCAYYRGMLFNGQDPGVDPEDVARMATTLEEAHAVFEAAGDRWNMARLCWLSSHYALSQADPARAVTLASAAEQAFGELGDHLSAAMSRSFLGILTGLSTGYATAEPLLASAFGVQQAYGDVIRGSHTLAAFACMRAGLGHGAEAARLFGACAAIEEQTGVRLPPAYEPLTELHRQMARDSVAADEWQVAFDGGHAAGFDVVIGGPAPGTG